MLTNKQLKLISSLTSKKYRDKYGLFIVEGEKGIGEFLKSHFELHSLYATSDLFDVQYVKMSQKELKKISQLTTPSNSVAVFKIPDYGLPSAKGLVVALDAVRDPGNLGTIIRLCDWFGVAELICSLDTVDCYNFKVVQATMGSLSRVKVVYRNLQDYFKGSQSPIYATMLKSESIYKVQLPIDAILLMGNEANGISEDLQEYINTTITIPRFDPQSQVESLNVATATAICLNEFRRRLLEGEV